MVPCCIQCQTPMIQPPWLCPGCLILLEKLSCLYDKRLPVYAKHWQRFYCLGAFHGPFANLVARSKLQADLVTLGCLSQLVARCIDVSCYCQTPTLIPVPMTAAGVGRRGFNQAEIIANKVGRLHAWPVRTDIIAMRETGRVQHLLDKQQRLINRQSAFQVLQQAPEYVMLVDDIYTTGATLTAMATRLRCAGTQRIEVCVLARTL